MGGAGREGGEGDSGEGSRVHEGGGGGGRHTGGPRRRGHHYLNRKREIESESARDGLLDPVQSDSHEAEDLHK